MIVWLSDFDSRGSGYANISYNTCQELSNRGYDVRAVGLFYRGEPHDYDFALYPVENMQQAMGVIQNMWNMFQFDVLVVAIDITIHEKLIRDLNYKPFKYLGIQPVEADPLCFSWALTLNSMDKSMIISEFGLEEAVKAGVFNASYFPVGIDMNVWKFSTQENRKKLKSAFGYENEFVVLTVADNQERKNLSASMKAFALFKDQNPKAKSKYIIVTKQHNTVGWKLDELARSMGIYNDVVFVERGLKPELLAAYYQMADVHLLLSKAEGLGMPTLEAMLSGALCINTNCTSNKELLGDGRGFLIDYEYTHIDPFGNGNRYWASPVEAANTLSGILCDLGDDEGLHVEMRQKAREFAEQFTWKQSGDAIEKVLTELGVKKNEN